MTSRIYFAARFNSEGLKDRDGYDLPNLVHRGWIRFDDDGTVQAFEFSDGGVERCAGDPQLTGSYSADGDTIRFSLKRRKQPDALDPPEEDVYWWPPTSQEFFHASEYEAQVHQGALTVQSSNPAGMRQFQQQAHEGAAFLPESARPAER